MNSVPRVGVPAALVTAVASLNPPQETLAEIGQLLREVIGRYVRQAPGAVTMDGLSGLTEDQLRCFTLNALATAGRLLSQDREGVLCREVRDRGEDRQGLRFSESRAAAAMHTDGMHMPDQVVPDVFTLTCVRTAASGGELSLVHVDDVLAVLPNRDQVVEVLGEPVHFATRGIDPAGRRTVLRRVLAPVDDGWVVTYARDYIDEGHRQTDVPPLAREQVAALDSLDAALERSLRISYRQQAGELLIVDNRRMLHGRSAYADAALPGRLLLRTWLSTQETS
jgi:hypothetical protein